MLFRYFGCHFREKAQKGGFLAFWAVLTTFGGQKLLLRPKSEKAQKGAKDKKSLFSRRARNSEKRRVLGTFLEPKTPKSAFFAFGQTFPSWSVLGAKSAPEAKNELIFTFCYQKWKNRIFAILVEKRAQNVTFIKGFALLAKVLSLIHI